MFGANRFKEIFETHKDRPLLLYGDPDVDGLMSLLLMCQFATMMGKEYSWYVNPDRVHGWTLKPESLRGYLVISADFSFSKSVLQSLVDNDVVVLSTDHHDINEDFIEVRGDSAEGIIINNQYSFEPEEDRYLSGAGVFYELICSLYPDFKSKEREAIVGITLLSDMRQIENPKARKYLKVTYSPSLDSPYIKYLIDNTLESDYGFGVPRLDRNFIDYTLSPFINALLRFDKTKEAVEFILGNGLLIGSLRERQKELIVEMMKKVQICKFSDITFLVVNASDFDKYSDVKITNFIGYLCNDYKNKNKGISDLGMVVKNGEVIRTSFRGRYDDVNYRSKISDLGIDAQGHAGAFGIQNFKPDNETWFKINDLVHDLELNHVDTFNVINASNLSVVLNTRGEDIANENCFVRDMYRTYIRYLGKNIKEIRHTYKMVEFSNDEYLSGKKADVESRGIKYKYIRDSDGLPVTKYIEYLVDGRKVKSFGVELNSDSLILPILEKGYIQLYVRESLG